MPGCPGDVMMPMQIQVGAAEVLGVPAGRQGPLERIRQLSLYFGDFQMNGFSFYGAQSPDRIRLPHVAGSRGVSLCQMNDVGLPVHVARAQVASALHVVVQVARMADNTRRVVQIAEVVGMGQKQPYRVRPVFDFRIDGRDPDGRVRGELEWTGKPSRYRRDVEMSGPASAAVDRTARLFAPPDADAPVVR